MENQLAEFIYHLNIEWDESLVFKSEGTECKKVVTADEGLEQIVSKMFN